MKLSTRGRYAVMALADMAGQVAQGRDAAVPLAEISARQEISLAYLEQLFGALRRAGLVASRRGAQGGYCLTRAPEEIRIGDITRAVDEPVTVTRCGNRGGCLRRHARCMTHDLWAELGAHIYAFLDAATLADVVHGRFGDEAAQVNVEAVR